ncbi:MAG: PEGA domain-containing protein [Lentisphaeria bacterium]|nr:PEGA domain-containing protein [Lentisphaeria bacterium]
MKRYLILLSAAISAVFVFCACGKAQPKSAKLELTGPKGMVAAVSGMEFSGSKLTLELPAKKYVFRFSAPGFRDDFRIITVSKGKTTQYKVNLEPAKAAVLIKSEPSGATVKINGHNCGTTPLVLPPYPAGDYSATLSMRGYSDTVVNWTISNERPVAVSKQLTSNTGALQITSHPSRARVFINNTEVGMTPFRAERSEGKYIVRLEKDNCSPEERSVTVLRHQTSKLNIKLHAKPGSIKISSTPQSAEVFIDSRKVGTTPCTINGLNAGKYKLAVSLAGFDPVEDDIEILPAITDSKHYNLVSSTGSVMFNVSPAGVQVLLDGKFLGYSTAVKPGAITTKDFKVDKLTPGLHEIRLFHATGRPMRKTIRFTVKKGKCTTLKNQSIWVANCEITRIDGTKERGAIFSDNNNKIFFESEPGIRVELDRRTIRHINMLNAN